MTVKMDEKNQGPGKLHLESGSSTHLGWSNHPVASQPVEIAMPRHISGNSSRKLYVSDRSCPPGTDNIGFLGERLSYGMSCSSGLFQMRIWDRRCQRFEVRNFHQIQICHSTTLQAWPDRSFASQFIPSQIQIEGFPCEPTTMTKFTSDMT